MSIGSVEAMKIMQHKPELEKPGDLFKKYKTLEYWTAKTQAVFSNIKYRYNSAPTYMPGCAFIVMVRARRAYVFTGPRTFYPIGGQHVSRY